MAANDWPGLELRHLTALLAVAREGSFGRAAASLGYTQSAISGQIAGLERIVGKRLVDRPRGARVVTLTPAGEALVVRTEAIVRELGAARSDLAALENGERGTLSVGIFQSVGSTVVPEAIRGLAQSHPAVVVDLRERSDDAGLLDAVESGELDLAFTVEPVSRSGLDAAPVLTDPYRLLVHAGHELVALERPVSLEELESVPLVVFDRCVSQGRLEAALAGLGVRPRIALRVEDARTIHSLVASGLACALVARLAATPDSDVVALELDVAIPPRQIAIAWSRDRGLTPAAERFVELVSGSADGLGREEARVGADDLADALQVRPG